MGACDLRINLGGMEMKNPVMPASGAYDYFEHNADVFPMDRLGAVMVKSVHRHPREGNSAPRITEVLGGMINAVGIPSVGIEAFMAQELPGLTPSARRWSSVSPATPRSTTTSPRRSWRTTSGWGPSS